MRFVFAALAVLLCTAPQAVTAQPGIIDEPERLAARSSPSPAQRAIAREVRDQARGRLKEFYARRGYWPMWVEDGEISPAADTLLDLLASARLDGLSSSDYNLRDLRRLLDRTQSGNPEDFARAELRLSGEFARYVRDMRTVRRASLEYADATAKPDVPSEEEVLRRAALAPSLSEYLATMGWMTPEYGGLRMALERHETRLNAAPGLLLPAGPTLRPGSTGERVRLLRIKLGLQDGLLFDDELGDAVAAFQSDRGLTPDRIVGSNTLAALNAQPYDHGRKLRLNLDRARELPGPYQRHVVVNAAAAELRYYNDGREDGAMKVVVGSDETPTPMMAGMIRYATLNPYWNVPADFVQKRIAPGVLSGTRLEKLGYEALSDWTRDAQVVASDKIDWRAVAAGKEIVRVRELPGPDNSMGRVKFMFPNEEGIYLHDTPNRALFDRDVRAFSNGCVRLEDAEAFGRWLFGKELTTESTDPEQYRTVPRPVPVYLTYLTIVPTEDGLRFLPDIYGRDGGDGVRLAVAR